MTIDVQDQDRIAMSQRERRRGQRPPQAGWETLGQSLLSGGLCRLVGKGHVAKTGSPRVLARTRRMRPNRARQC